MVQDQEGDQAARVPPGGEGQGQGQGALLEGAAGAREDQDVTRVERTCPLSLFEKDESHPR